MAVQDKIIASVLLVHSTLGVLWTVWIASHVGFPVVFLAANLVLATIGIIAGVGWFRGHRWDTNLSILFFAVQLVHVLTQPSSGRLRSASISTLPSVGLTPAN